MVIDYQKQNGPHDVISEPSVAWVERVSESEVHVRAQEGGQA